jgi:hypothetical protein
MQRCLVLIAALGFLAPAPSAHAQQDPRPAGSKENASPSQLENGTILYLELSKAVNAKKARIGDEVKASLLADVVSHGKIVVRRDSKLIGHVTEAQARTKDNPESRLGIVFDKILVKHGPEVPLSSVLLAVRPSARFQTEAPPTAGSHGPNPMGSYQADWPYPTPRRSTSRLGGSRLEQGLDGPINNKAKMQQMEVEGLSLEPSHHGSNKVVVSLTRTIKLESRMRLELRVDNNAKQEK